MGKAVLPLKSVSLDTTCFQKEGTEKERKELILPPLAGNTAKPSDSLGVVFILQFSFPLPFQ